MKDASIKKAVKEVLEHCALDKGVLDREVHINFSGDEAAAGKLADEKEFDVVAKFAYGGKNILFLFECEDSQSVRGVKTAFRGYRADISAIEKNLDGIHVLSSKDRQIQGRHFKDVEIVRVCFVYGANLPNKSFQVCSKEAKRQSFFAWNRQALTYYQNISGILGTLTKYEMFKEFELNLESGTTFTIPALELKQKGRKMYLGTIHPGRLLKIAYVVRRASERTYAYQRMLSKERIRVITDFISSQDLDSFIPNAVIVVADSDPKVQSVVRYDRNKQELTLPMSYASCWMIDGQHRAYGFVGTAYEDWSDEKHEPFDLPIIVFKELPEPLQTQTFININYFQKRIKANLLCDLATVTKDLRHRLTWPSLIGRELNESDKSPLKDLIKVSELHQGRPISLSSLVQYGLLETLLGYRSQTAPYSGPLFRYAPFDRSTPVGSSTNVGAFQKQVKLIIRFLNAVRVNTETGDKQTDPWINTVDYSLLRPTGINALFMVLARILGKHPDAGLDLDSFLKPLSSMSLKSDVVAKKGGGWKGFRGLANAMIRRLNKGKVKNKLLTYGEKEKI